MRIPEPYTIKKRNDSNTLQFTLNRTCGLSERACDEWRRRSFQDFPDELAHYRNVKYSPTAKGGIPPAAKAAVQALIAFLNEKQKEGSVRRIKAEDVTVGEWIGRFTSIGTSPRAGINAAKNRPYSCETVEDGYKGNYERHIKDDPICSLKMAEVEEVDILEYLSRFSVKKLNDGKPAGGRRVFVVTVAFMRMTFNEYQRINKRQSNPFQFVPVPKSDKRPWDALPEDEMLKLFMPGVLEDTLELAVCGAMFLAGMRRAEVGALKPEDLDWVSPKITIQRSWQRFNSKNKVEGPPKGKKAREAPFDVILQNAIKKLWKENGQHERVFTQQIKLKNGKIKYEPIGSAWVKGRFKKWLERAGIELGGRRIVPHSSRHSIASLLEKRGVSLRYIQDFLGHSDLKTTLGYLHSTSETIRGIGNTITETREKHEQQQQKEEAKNIIRFKVS